jgi:hypothetical protein
MKFVKYAMLSAFVVASAWVGFGSSDAEAIVFVDTCTQSGNVITCDIIIVGDTI